MSLRDLTAERHKMAELTPFMQAVFRRNLPRSVWVDYTYQKWFWYGAIEDRARDFDLISDIPEIRRAPLIREDYCDMVRGETIIHKQSDLAREYSFYILDLDDPKKVLSHLYVWHMGDMYGGQMIKKILPGPHRHLTFENAPELIAKLRTRLDDSMSDEANCAFDWAIKILNSYDV